MSAFTTLSGYNVKCKNLSFPAIANSVHIVDTNKFIIRKMMRIVFLECILNIGRHDLSPIWRLVAAVMQLQGELGGVLEGVSQQVDSVL